MRKIILYIATTLDGYIADIHDGFDFLYEYDSIKEVQDSYALLMSRVDTIIMGRTTYEVINGVEWPYHDKTSYIITHQSLTSSHPSIHFTGDVLRLVQNVRSTPGGDIWLVGGGVLIETFLALNLIDEYQIALIPKLIGQGKRLFNPSFVTHKLKLMKTETMGEIVMLTYTKIA